MSTGRLSTRRWALLGVVMLALWQFGLTLAFAARAEGAIQLLALVGTLVWAFPLGLAVGTLFHRRWHILWLFPVALPLTATILYLGFTTAEILPSGNALDLNPANSPGMYHVPIAMTVCPFSAAGIAFGFLAHPRPYAMPKRYRCIACGYDISRNLSTGRCPECGHQLIPGVDFPPTFQPNTQPNLPDLPVSPAAPTATGPPAPADRPALPAATPPAEESPPD